MPPVTVTRGIVVVLCTVVRAVEVRTKVVREVTVTVRTAVRVLTSVAVLVGVVGCATLRQSQSCWIRGMGRSPRVWRASRAGSGMERRRRPKTVVSSVTVAVTVLTDVLGVLVVEDV